MGLNIEEQKAVERFQKDVVEPSMAKLVVLDFWAEWCGPCKALTPMLEKVAAEYADKGVVLKKVNVDEEQFIASQFQVQSIPTVYAMFQGRPVADLTSARSESQLKQALDQILAQIPLDPNAAGGEGGQNDGMPDVEQLIAMGEQLLAAGENEKALQLYSEIASAAPPEIASRAEVQSGLIRALLANGQHAQAQATFDALTWRRPVRSWNSPVTRSTRANWPRCETRPRAAIWTRATPMPKPPSRPTSAMPQPTNCWA